MSQITKQISVDVGAANLFPAIVAKQADANSRFLTATILNEGVQMTVPSTAVVTLNVRRADNLAHAYEGIVNEDGTVTVPLTSWALELDDQVKCSISIYDTTEDRKLTTTTFTIQVQKAEITEDDITEDDNYDILLDLIEQAEAAMEGAEVLSNKVTSITSQSTDTQYPSAKAVKDLVDSNALPKITSEVELKDLDDGLYQITTGFVKVYTSTQTENLLKLKKGWLIINGQKAQFDGYFTIGSSTDTSDIINISWVIRPSVVYTYTYFTDAIQTMIDGKENLYSRVTEVNANSDNDHYPTALAVRNAIQAALYADEDASIISNELTMEGTSGEAASQTGTPPTPTVTEGGGE